MGCVCFKSADPEIYGKINKFIFCSSMTHKCRCFNCFKKNKVDYDNELTQESVLNIDNLELVKVDIPSVKINDIETTSEKIKNTFKGVYMRDRSLSEFVNKEYIENTKINIKDNSDDNDNNTTDDK